MSRSLTVLVEGDGDAQAVPGLVLRLLADMGRGDWVVGKTKKVRGLGSLTKRLDDQAAYLRLEAPDAVLVLLDLDDGCPLEAARALAARWRAHALPFPVAVVLAHREFEAWFLASLPSIAPHVADLPDALVYDKEPEGKRGAKEWLTAQMPKGRTYEETLHQKAYARHLDPDAAQGRSRSFRRLVSALTTLTDAAATPVVTP